MSRTMLSWELHLFTKWLGAYFSCHIWRVRKDWHKKNACLFLADLFTPSLIILFSGRGGVWFLRRGGGPCPSPGKFAYADQWSINNIKSLLNDINCSDCERYCRDKEKLTGNKKIFNKLYLTCFNKRHWKKLKLNRMWLESETHIFL